MAEPKDVCEYLEALRKENKKEFQSYTSFIQYFENKARKNNVPIVGQFELTPLCNLSCKMCYVHLMPEQMNNRPLLGVEEWKSLMKQAFSAGLMDATLTGGECLTYPGVDELYLFLQELGCQVTVLTNGVLLNEDRIHFFTEHPPSTIQVTLYGASEEDYERVTGRREFATVLRNLRMAKDAGLPLIVTITPNSFLGEGVFETIRVARTITENVIINTELFVPEDEPWRSKDWQELDKEFYARIIGFSQDMQGKHPQTMPIEQLPPAGGKCKECSEKGVECGGGRSSYVINWKGEMLICNRMEAKAYPLRDGFSQAWKEISEIANNWPRIPECKGCAYEAVCSKCVANKGKYAEPGKQPMEYCEYVRYMVSKGVLPVSQCDI